MKKLLLLTAIAGASLLTSAAKADVVLLVNLSTPNQVTVTATNGLSAATRTGSTTTGFYLQNFFNSMTTGAVTSAALAGSNISTFLQSPDNSPSGFRSGSTDPGFNIFSYSATTTTGFTQGIQAFQGTATFTLSAAAYNLAVTALGAAVDRNVFFPADDQGDLATATIIGTWQVVPEPSTVAFSVLGGAGLLIAALRKKKQNI